MRAKQRPAQVPCLLIGWQDKQQQADAMPMLISLIEQANQACDDDDEDGEVSINSKHALIGSMAIGVIDSERYLVNNE